MSQEKCPAGQPFVPRRGRSNDTGEPRDPPECSENNDPRVRQHVRKTQAEVPSGMASWNMGCDDPVFVLGECLRWCRSIEVKMRQGRSTLGSL